MMFLLRRLSPIVLVIFGVQAAAATEVVQIARGPVLGSPTPHSIAVWVQGSVPVEVRVHAERSDGEGRPVVSPWQELNPTRRLAAKFALEGLEPDTRYRYRIESRNETIWVKEDATFKTPPLEGRPTRLTIAAGSGANNWRRPEPKIWSTIAEAGPEVFLALGDTPYADGLLWENVDAWEAARNAYREDPSDENRHIRRTLEILFRTRAREAMALAYEYFREVKGFSEMARKSFWVATWDDHDTGVNNGDRDNPVLFEALDLFQLFTPNPSFGLEDAHGVFWRQRWGDVDLILLDDQSWRTPTHEARLNPETATLLGEAQFAWLVETLKGSDATFKIVACGSPFNDDSRKTDSWVTYPKELNRLMDAIAAHRVNGVVLMSGDVHRSELFRLPWLEERGGYSLFEMVAGPLFQKGRSCGKAVPYREFCTGTTDSEVLELFSWIEADTTIDDPALILQVRDNAGEVLLDRRLRASELRWPKPAAETLPEHLE